MRALGAGTVAVALVVTCAGLGYGCADIVGADFDSKKLLGAGSTGSGAGGAPQECADTAECEDRFPGLGYTCVGGVCVTECQVTSECKDKFPVGTKVACIKGVCTEVTSPDCTAVIGDIEAEDPPPIFVGVLSDLTSDLVQLDQVHYNLAAAELAHKHIGDKIVGPGKNPRPIVLVECDETKDAVAAAKHLVEVVGTPILLGPFGGQAQVNVFNSVVKPIQDAATSVVMFVPTAYPAFLEIPGNAGSGWSCAPSLGTRALAAAALVAEQEPNIRASYGLGPMDPLKVALLTPADVAYDDLAQEIADTVLVNGRPVSSLGLDFKKVLVPNSWTCDAPCDYASPKTALLAFEPHLIITNAPQGLYTNLVKAFEKELDPTYDSMGRCETAFPGTKVRPYYVSAEWDYTVSLMAGCPAGVPDTFGFEDRIRIIDYYPLDDTRFISFTSDFKAYVNVQFQLPDAQMALAYDCAFLYTYALVAALRADEMAPINKASIGEGLQLLKPAFGGDMPAVIYTGKADISLAQVELEQGKRIELNGTYGPLGLDPEKHAPLFNLTVLCPRVGARGADLPGKKSGQYYDIDTGSLQGTYACD